jgi:hypothetical protein
MLAVLCALVSSQSQCRAEQFDFFSANAPDNWSVATDEKYGTVQFVSPGNTEIFLVTTLPSEGKTSKEFADIYYREFAEMKFDVAEMELTEDSFYRFLFTNGDGAMGYVFAGVEGNMADMIMAMGGNTDLKELQRSLKATGKRPFLERMFAASVGEFAFFRAGIPGDWSIQYDDDDEVVALSSPGSSAALVILAASSDGLSPRDWADRTSESLADNGGKPEEPEAIGDGIYKIPFTNANGAEGRIFTGVGGDMADAVMITGNHPSLDGVLKSLEVTRERPVLEILFDLARR